MAASENAGVSYEDYSIYVDAADSSTVIAWLRERLGPGDESRSPVVVPLRVSSACNHYDVASTTARAATPTTGASTSPAPSSKLSDDSGTAIGVPSRSQVEWDAGRPRLHLAQPELDDRRVPPSSVVQPCRRRIRMTIKAAVT